MGHFKIEINGVGGHGVDRSTKDGEKVNFDADGTNTPDAIASKIVKELMAQGNTLVTATMTHWPGTPQEVVDDLISGTRKGNF